MNKWLGPTLAALFSIHTATAQETALQPEIYTMDILVPTHQSRIVPDAMLPASGPGQEKALQGMNFIKVDFQTYTFLAKDKTEKQIECAGLKVTLKNAEEAKSLKDAFFWLGVADPVFSSMLIPSEINSDTELSYGGCIRIHGNGFPPLTYPSIFLLEGTNEEGSIPVPVWSYEKTEDTGFAGAFDLARSKQPACLGRGWNESYTKLRLGDAITVTDTCARSEGLTPR